MITNKRLATLALLVGTALIVAGPIVDGLTDYSASWSWIIYASGYALDSVAVFIFIVWMIRRPLASGTESKDEDNTHPTRLYRQPNKQDDSREA
jgi:hypothetical protein